MEAIIQNIPAVISIILPVALALMIVTNIIVEVVKGLTWGKLPTNVLAFFVAMAVTLLAFFAMCQIAGEEGQQRDGHGDDEGQQVGRQLPPGQALQDLDDDVRHDHEHQHQGQDDGDDRGDVLNDDFHNFSSLLIDGGHRGPSFFMLSTRKGLAPETRLTALVAGIKPLPVVGARLYGGNLSTAY